MLSVVLNQLTNCVRRYESFLSDRLIMLAKKSKIYGMLEKKLKRRF